jgi:two-component system, chemotaxis family, chemotaxis protein CheY
MMGLPKHLQAKHFLVCDDEESMRSIVVSSLKNLGVTKITQATSGQAGYQSILASIIADSHVEFVITDLMMPDGTGIELAKMIRANEMTKHIPIIMVTSKAEIHYVMDAIKSGVNNYLLKPWSLEDFHKKLLEVDKKLNPGGE